MEQQQTNNQGEKMKYQVINRKTKQAIGKPYSSINRVMNRIDKLDNEYGGYVYWYVTINN